jgi:hypothetical protein
VKDKPTVGSLFFVAFRSERILKATKNANVKVKCTLAQELWLCAGRTAHRGNRNIALLFMTLALEGGEESASRPGHPLPPGKTLYQLYRRLGGLQGRSGQVRNISTLRGFDPRTVQPVASRYTY